MTTPYSAPDLARSARVMAWLAGRSDVTAAEICLALDLTRHTIVRALRPLIAAELVLVEAEIGYAKQGVPPGSAYRYTAVADPALPDWLPMPEETDALPAHAHGGIVASALRCAAPSVWAWAGRAA